MLTVAEGGALGAVVVDAHAARRRIVIPVKAELMKLVFMVLRSLVGLTRIFARAHADGQLVFGRDTPCAVALYLPVTRRKAWLECRMKQSVSVFDGNHSQISLRDYLAR